jgi:hypothetical protein
LEEKFDSEALALSFLSPSRVSSVYIHEFTQDML